MSSERDPVAAGREQVDDEIARLLPPEVMQDIEEAEPHDREMLLSFAVKHIQYEGPIPPGYMLREYEDVLPGAADRIFRMAEQQASHRQELEKKVVESKSRAEILGVVFAGIIVLAVAIGGIFLIYTGHGIAGFSALITGLGGVAVTFVYGTRSERRERAEKRAEQNGN